MKIKIKPEPWSASDAHRIAARARAIMSDGRKRVSFKHGPFYVEVKQNAKTTAENNR